METTLFSALQHESLIYNYHTICISKTTIENHAALRDTFRVVAVNTDETGLEYAALVEHRTLPIYAAQFHPEKNNFEWSVYRDVPHGARAVELSQYLANFFVGEARKSRNIFPDVGAFYKRNINNYSPEYALQTINATLESCYFFNDERTDLGVDTSDTFSLLDI